MKETIELCTKDSMDYQFSIALEMPRSKNPIRIISVATVEFPLTRGVEACTINK